MKYIELMRRDNPYYRVGVIVQEDGRSIQVLETSQDYLKEALPHVRNLTQAEEFPAHLKSIEVRIGKS